MNLIKWLIPITGFCLTACGPGATIMPADAFPPDNPTPVPSITYPPPDPTSPAQSEPVIYPAPGEGDFTPSVIPWEKAESMLLDGVVAEVFQAHSLDVTLILKDGTHLKTVEPEIDEIFRVAERCGSLCSDLIIATE